MKAPRNDFEASSQIHPGEWLSQHELAKLARRRTPPVRGCARHFLGVICLVSLALTFWAATFIGPKVPKALDWLTDHISAALAAITF